MSTNKFLRASLIIIGIVIGVILIVGATQPKSISVTRSVVINAPKSVVFEQMVRFKNWPNWSPWSRLDTSMKNTFEGNDGTTGSVYSWVGDDRKTGTVKITNTGVNGTELQFSFKLIKPEAPASSGILKAEDSAGMTKATMTFTNHFDYPWNAMVILTDLNKTIGPDLEKAMKNLKEVAEKK